jgi:hypothetical protein
VKAKFYKYVKLWHSKIQTVMMVCIAACQPLLINAQVQWTCIGPFHTEEQRANQNFGHIKAISAHPTNDSADIYIGACGIWHTKDGGEHWQCITDNFDKPMLNVSQIIVDYQVSPRRLVASTGGGVLSQDWYQAGVVYSEDDGHSWHTSTIEGEPELGGRTTTALIQGKTKTDFFCATNGRIFLSNDGAKNFTVLAPQSDGDGKYFKALPWQHFARLHYDASIDALFCSQNDVQANGTRYPCALLCITNVSSPQLREIVDLSALCNSIGRPQDRVTGFQIVASAARSEYIGIMRTVENVVDPHWFELELQSLQITEHFNMPSSGGSFQLEVSHGISCNDLNNDVAYLCGTTTFKTQDGGRTWKPLYAYGFGENNSPHADVRGMLISKHTKDGLGDHLLLGTDGGLSYSGDGGSTFRNLNGLNLPITDFYGCSVSPFSGNISAGSQDNSIMTYLPKEKRWLIAIRGDGYDVCYSKVHPGLGVGQYNYLSSYTTSNDQAPFTGPVYKTEGGEGHQMRTLTSTKNGSTYFGKTKICELKDGQQSWSVLPAQPVLPNYLASIAVGGDSDEIIYAANLWGIEENNVWRSMDHGKSWTDISSRRSTIGDHQAPLGAHKVFKLECTETGLEVFACFGYYNDPLDQQNGINRVWHSTDAGDTWRDISEGLPNLPVWDVRHEPQSNTLFCANAFGIYSRNLDAILPRWSLYGRGLPKTVVTEIDFDVLDHSIIACTYGRGLWRATLPKVGPQIHKRGTLLFSNADSTACSTLARSLEIKKKADLIIEQPVYLGKNVTITIDKPQQLIIRGKGKVVADGRTKEDWLIIGRR